MEEIIQIKVSLNESNPLIWRRLLVEKTATFMDLHDFIQEAMGWENCHMFDFRVGKSHIGEPDEMFEEDFAGRKFMNANTTVLDSMISKTKQKFEYEYDFGDGWIHQVLVEKFLPRDEKIKYPQCLDGEMSCPPEDCGGIYAYYDMLDILADKKNPEREDMIEWLGADFDPKRFDVAEANERLKGQR